VRPPAVQVAPREPSREAAKHVGSKPAPGHPWRQGYEQRMKLQRLNRSQESALVGVTASATPKTPRATRVPGLRSGGHPNNNRPIKRKGTLLMR
jgi:hypothetical protein